MNTTPKIYIPKFDECQFEPYFQHYGGGFPKWKRDEYPWMSSRSTYWSLSRAAGNSGCYLHSNEDGQEREAINEARLLTSALHKSITKNKPLSKGWENLLGCNLIEFKEHIERQFKQGMSWTSWGEWHLDHIRPLASFDLDNQEELLESCNYKNFQPLWAFDNCSKGAKWTLR